MKRKDVREKIRKEVKSCSKVRQEKKDEIVKE